VPRWSRWERPISSNAGLTRRRRSCCWPFRTIQGFPLPYRFLAACYAHLERLDEARAIVARLRAISPLVLPDDLPFRNPEDRELLLSGLRLAAGEAT
jgi:hypothetical protein